MKKQASPGTNVQDKRRTPSGARKATLVLREPSFVPPFEKVTSVAVVAFTRDGDLVATIDKRGPDLAGGHVAVGETKFKQTARREALEEAGIKLRKLKFLCAIESDLYGSTPDLLSYMVIMVGSVSKFVAEPIDGQRLVLSPEQFKAQHTALRKELIDPIVDGALKIALDAKWITRDLDAGIISSATSQEPRGHMSEVKKRFLELLSKRYVAHPLHEVSIGESSPDIVNAFIEITSQQTAKSELDKKSGILAVDRPLNFSSTYPFSYGYVPRTHCGESVARFCAKRTGRKEIIGDGDPLDICVITERPFTQGGFLMHVRPIGGFRMIDKGEADDKIIAVLPGDVEFGEITDISQLKPGAIDRGKHFFLSYKQLPGTSARTVEITHVYGRDDAHEVIRRSVKDYNAKFGDPSTRDEEMWDLLIAGVAEALKADKKKRRRRN